MEWLLGVSVLRAHLSLLASVKFLRIIRSVHDDAEGCNHKDGFPLRGVSPNDRKNNLDKWE